MKGIAFERYCVTSTNVSRQEKWKDYVLSLLLYVKGDQVDGEEIGVISLCNVHLFSLIFCAW